MVTVRETQQIANDNNRHVFAKSPTHQPPRLVYLKTTTANVKPGMLVIRGTGAAGEGTCAECAGTSIVAFGIAEWDEKQVLDCSVAYAQYDLIPVIPIYGNEGTILRNVIITDPNGDIPADTGFQSGNASLVVGDGTGLIVARSLYFIADSANPDRLVVYLSPSLDVVA